MTETDDGRPDPTRCKVGRLIEEYGFDGLGDELARRWTGDGYDRHSLRDLAALFNRRVIETELQRADRMGTDPDVDAIYQSLRGDDVGPGAKNRKRRELERDGVNVDRLEDSFVTHQAVHTYLTEYRGVELEESTPNVNDASDTLARLRNRTSAVTETTLNSLAASGEITGDDYEALVEIRVLCRNCGEDYQLDQLLDAGGCSCTQ